MNEINWLIVIPGWIAAIGLLASQIAYFNRWIGRAETDAKNTREIADKAHFRIDANEIKEDKCRSNIVRMLDEGEKDKDKIADALIKFENSVLSDIAMMKERLEWIVKKLDQK